MFELGLENDKGNQSRAIPINWDFCAPGGFSLSERNTDVAKHTLKIDF